MCKVDLRSGGCPCKNSGHEAVSLNLCQQESFSSQHECQCSENPGRHTQSSESSEPCRVGDIGEPTAEVDIEYFGHSPAMLHGFFVGTVFLKRE